MDPFLRDHFYGDYGEAEEPFQQFLDESLGARTWEMLYDLVSEMGLPAGASVLDLGCGSGRQAVVLRERFGFSVVGIDPVVSGADVVGMAEALPFLGGGFDLVWCKDVLVHVPDLVAAFGEIARVLRPGGHAVVFMSSFAVDLTELEMTLLGAGMSLLNTDPALVVAAIESAGLRLEQNLDVGIEWGEASHEQLGTGGRRLLHTARLLRDPDRYRERFGPTNYDIMLADCLWHVLRMLGKLGQRVFVLSRP